MIPIRDSCLPHGIYLSKGQYATTSNEREHMSKISYASTIGSIMYAIMCTRLDVVYALSMMKIYQSNLGDGH